jgi:outer membrane protein TolC
MIKVVSSVLSLNKKGGMNLKRVLGKLLLFFALVSAFSFAFASPLLAEEIGKEGEVVRLSLEDALKEALKNNLDIKIENYNLRTAEESITAAEGNFDFTAFAETSYNDSRTEPFNYFSDLKIDISEQYSFNTGIRKNLALSGGNFEISFQDTRSLSNSPFSLYNPYHRPQLAFQFTQPLLKNFGGRVARYNVIIARKNREITLTQFRNKVIATLAQVQQLYFNLVFNIKDLEVKRGSLSLARNQLEITKAKVEVGSLPPIEITQAEAAVAQREVDIISAESAVDKAKDELLRAIKGEFDLPSWDVNLLPITEPTFEPEVVDLEECIKKAMENRPDLLQQRLNIGVKEESLNYQKNQLKPELNLQVSASFRGLDGTKPIVVGNPFGGDYEIIGYTEGGLGGAVKDVFGGEFRTWTVGFSFSLPIENRAAEAARAQARIGLAQEQESLRNLEQQAILEVRDGVRNVVANLKQVEASRKARELAEKQLRAEEERFAVGASTNFEVLRLQDDLASAQSQEIKAVVDYNIALFDLKRVMGTLLEDSNITVKE